MMAHNVFALGVAAALILIGLLTASLARPGLNLWPTTERHTWQHALFWPLFRGLHLTAIAVALLHRTPWLGLPDWLRATAGLALAAALLGFSLAFLRLGRSNSYGARAGLVTTGSYALSRNPQMAMLMVIYTALVVVADSALTAALCTALVAIYHLMVLAEERWLTKAYGEAYRAYARQVPRYIGWRHWRSAKRAGDRAHPLGRFESP